MSNNILNINISNKIPEMQYFFKMYLNKKNKEIDNNNLL